MGDANRLRGAKVEVVWPHLQRRRRLAVQEQQHDATKGYHRYAEQTARDGALLSAAAKHL